jgi:acyl dehydratase
MQEIETVGLGITWDDLPVGRTFKSISRTITETDLINFISCTGMLELLFTSTEFIKDQSAIKGRLVPGALVYTFAEGLLCQSVMQGVGFAFLGMEFNIKNPAFVGDTIHVKVEVTDARPSKNRPGLGLVRTRNVIFNQNGIELIEYTPLRLVKGKAYKASPHIG